MPPSSVGHNDIYYKVECQLCPEKPHSFMPCENISIGKEGMNLTKTNLTVAHLYNNTCYKFSVTTLNGVSTEANKKHWNSAMIRVQFSGKTNRNHPDACKLIWKNQPYFEGNRKGVFLAFSTDKYTCKKVLSSSQYIFMMIMIYRYDNISL